MGFMDFFKRKSSGDVAKDRLKLLLVSDRANCSPDVMELIKNDIIKVISKYMEIDAEGLDIQITQTESDTGNGTVPALYANIPIRDMHHTPKKEEEKYEQAEGTEQNGGSQSERFTKVISRE